MNRKIRRHRPIDDDTRSDSGVIEPEDDDCKLINKLQARNKRIYLIIQFRNSLFVKVNLI